MGRDILANPRGEAGGGEADLGAGDGWVAVPLVGSWPEDAVLAVGPADVFADCALCRKRRVATAFGLLVFRRQRTLQSSREAKWTWQRGWSWGCC